MSAEIPTSAPFRAKKFDISYLQQKNPTGEHGFIQTLNRSSPVWFAEYETAPLQGQRYNDMRAFLDLLDGSMNTFLGFDPRRPMPYAYKTSPVGSNPWGAAVLLTGFDYTDSTISLAQMLIGRTITKGDYISVIDDNDTWYLFRSMETRNADGSGLVNDLLVRPRPQIAAMAGTLSVRYQKACIEMKLMGGIQEDDSVDTFPVLRFKGAQYTNRVPA